MHRCATVHIDWLVRPPPLLLLLIINTMIDSTLQNARHVSCVVFPDRVVDGYSIFHLLLRLLRFGAGLSYGTLTPFHPLFRWAEVLHRRGLHPTFPNDGERIHY